MTRTRLVLAPRAPELAPSYLMLDAEGHLLERGALALADGGDSPAMRTVLVVPGADARAQWLHLPTRNDRQALAAARLALDDHLALAGQDLHLALGPLEPDGSRLVVVVATAKLKGWLEALDLHGIKPDVVLPDHLALPEPAGDAVVALRFGPSVAVRGPRLALTAEPELLEILMEGREPILWPSSEEGERLLAQGALRPAINLLQGPFDPRRDVAVTRKEMRRLLILGALVLASPILLTAAGLLRDDMAARRTEARSLQKVIGVLPAASRENPGESLEAQLSRTRLATGGGAATLAAHLFSAVEGIEQAQLERLIVMPDGAVRATLTYSNFSDIEMMRRAMRRAGIAMREEGAREEQGRVVSDVILGVRS